LSPRDPPLWTRGVAAVLMIVASWWLRETDALRDAVGESIALLALAVVSASILRGMHLPLGLWPEGPWRERFARSVVVGAAVVFGVLVVALAPDKAIPQTSIDAGMAALVTAGVVAWGFALGLVRQRRYLVWYALAVAAAAAPLIGAVVGGAVWTAGSWRSFGFLAAVGASSSLISLELAFRRLMIGQPDRAGLVLVLLGALPVAAWALLAAPLLPGFAASPWLILGAGAGAGCLYVLSGSLLVSSLYTGVLFASLGALTLAVPADAAGAIPTGWWFAAVHGVVVAALSVVILHRRGLFAGLR
jgi:hypothetical protein